MNSRQQIQGLFNKGFSGPPPLFSGLISVTEVGLESQGLMFYEIHGDAVKMARAAASTYRVSGFGSAVLPLDLCVEAEALGATVDFMKGSEWADYPRVVEFRYKSIDEFAAESAEIAVKFSQESAVNQSRIPIVLDAIKLLKEDVGNEVVIGSYVPGPFTLLSMLVETGALYASLRRSAEAVHNAMEILTQVIVTLGNAYHLAGADFLTIHEMGGSPGALGPKLFEKIVLPHLKVLFSRLPRPAVLSACGRTTGTMKLLAASGADALSVDQTNDLVQSRKELPDVLLFGNLDPVGVISQGTPDEIRKAVASAVRSGVDAIWPGCDFYPQTPLENLRALVEASRKF